MKPKDIDKLVEKFFAGETTASEEVQLKELVSGGKLPEHLSYMNQYFMVMDDLSADSLDKSFDERLFSTIESKEAKPKTMRLAYRLTSVAAVVLLLISIWFGTDLFQPKEVYGTIDDPVIAFQETKKVLDEVSKKMNKGLVPAKKTVDKVEENVQKVEEVKKIDDALKKTKNINKLEKASEFLKSFNKVYVDYGNS
jgi:hypothetical protein